MTKDNMISTIKTIYSPFPGVCKQKYWKSINNIVIATSSTNQSFKLEIKFFLYVFQKYEEKYISFSRITFPVVEYNAPKEGPKGIKQIKQKNKLNVSADITMKIKNIRSNILLIVKYMLLKKKAIT